MAELQLTDKNCVGYYLIDENLCLNKSKDVLNHFFGTTTNSINQLSSFTSSWDNTFSIFSQISSNLSDAEFTVQTLSGQWNSAFNFVTTTSSFFNRPFEIIFNQVIDHGTFFGNFAAYQEFIRNWLNSNFPAIEYPINQSVNVRITLRQNSSMGFSYHNGYHESCWVGGSRTIQCDMCPIGHIKCNHPDAKERNDIPGCNFCNTCNVHGSGAAAAATCSSSGAAYLGVNYSATLNFASSIHISTITYTVNSTHQWI